MSQETIQVYSRHLSQNLNALRQTGLIPGIMYGQSLKTSLPIQINVRDLQKVIASYVSTTTFPVEYEGKVHQCILRDYQTDRLHTKLLHVDLQYVKDDEIIKLQIPVTYEGIDFLNSKKLILEKSISKIPVVGPIQNLPDAFNIDVSLLDRGAKILANQAILPADTELLLKPQTILATVQ